DRPAAMDSAAARLERLGERLAAAGLRRLAVVPVADLDAELADVILAAARAAGLEPGERTARVVVVGNDGGRFWNLMSPAERAEPDPIDTYSAARVGSELAALGGDSVLLYPG